MDTSSSTHQVLRAGQAAVALAVILLVLKSWAYLTTGSTAVLSSLLDSGMDALISLMTWGSLYYSIRPPDDDHRYGHGKMEGMTALAQSIAIFAGAIFLTYEGIARFFTPSPIAEPGIGIGVMIVSIIATLILVNYQTKIVQNHKSLAIESDRGHYIGDVLINASTIIILALVPITGWIWLDPLFALVVAGAMIRVAFPIGRKAIDMLLDREVAAELKQQIDQLIRQDGAIKDIYDLRVIQHGMRYIVSYDLELDGDITLRQAHDIALASEQRIRAQFPGADIRVHMDPAGAHAHHRSLSSKTAV